MTEALVSSARHGGLLQLESLLQLEQVAQEVDKLGATGENALHLAVWRNHGALASALLEAGADVNVRDGESGWTALHKALYWGHLRLGAALLSADASLSLPDWRGRAPLDLLSHELRCFLGAGPGDVFSWGSGSNYTLGTGSTDVELHPTRLVGLHDAQALVLSAAKFHSAAVTQEGQLYTWGWGRGGRLGHPEAHIHSGDSAVILPRLVAALGRRQVAAVACAKHHTVLCTAAGEVLTFGSNRYGQLGYAVDTQPIPKRVAALRQRVVAVAAANKHSVAVTAGGEVFTWGGNAVGQLGYGSVDSTSNATPRLVEAMKGKRVVAAAAAKRHTLVLTAEGEVYTWGHRGVSPRRVALAGARDTSTASGEPLRFHRGHAEVARPAAVAVCAGAAHSAVLTGAGVVLCWRSADPALQLQEVLGPLAGRRVVSISAGKYRTAAVTEQGEVCMWEGRSDYFPADGRQPGSGSKKMYSSRGHPIPRPALALLGGEGGSAGSYGAGDAPASGSFGSLSRRGVHFERFAAEREATQGGLSFGGPSSLGVRGATPPSSRSTPAKAAAAGDAFVPIIPERVEGLKRVVHVAVGEKHSLAVQRWAAAQLRGLPFMPWLADDLRAASPAAGWRTLDDGSGLFMRVADGDEGGRQLATPRTCGDLSAEPSGADSAPGSPEVLYSPMRPGDRRRRASPGEVGVPTLQRLCEEEVARHLVDPRTTLQVLEYADVAGASMLRAYCLSVAVCNLDAVLLEARGTFEALPPHLLGELERLWKLRLGAAGSGEEEGEEAAGDPAGAAWPRGLAPEPSGPEEEHAGLPGAAAAAESAAPASWQQPAWQQRAGGRAFQPGRRPTAAPPALGEAEGLPEGAAAAALASTQATLATGPGAAAVGPGSSFRGHSEVHAEAAGMRLLRTLQKKLEQIASLEERAVAGAALDAQQRAKVQQRPVLQAAMRALEGGVPVEDVQSILRAAATAVEEVAGTAATAAASSSSAGPSSAGKGARSASKGKGGKGSARKACAPGPQRPGPSSDGSELPGDLSGLIISGLSMGTSSSTLEAAQPALPGPGSTEPSALMGSSPPASALVPAFGLGEGLPEPGSVAAAAQPAAAAAAPAEPMSPVATQVVGFKASGDSLSAAAERQRSSGKGRDGKAKRTGGLSMFLRGHLDAGSAAPPPPAPAGPAAPPAAPAAPAWGGKGAAPPQAAASLREILQHETGSGAAAPAPRTPGSSKPPTSAGKPGGSAPGAACATARSRSAGPESSVPHPGPSAGGVPMRMSLASFMQQSSPVAIEQQLQQPQKAAAGPAWGGTAGASPPPRGASLLRIQEEQHAAAAAALPPIKTHGTSPPASRRLSGGLPAWRTAGMEGAAAAAGAGTTAAAAAGASVALLGTSPTGSSLVGTSPLGSRGGFAAAALPQQSKWYVPDESRAAQKSLTAIQAEERAVNELSKRYGLANVRVVTRQAKPPGLPAPAARPAAGQQQQR